MPMFLSEKQPLIPDNMKPFSLKDLREARAISSKRSRRLTIRQVAAQVRRNNR